MYYFGCFILNIPEEKFWKLTLRKFNSIMRQKMQLEGKKNG